MTASINDDNNNRDHPIIFRHGRKFFQQANALLSRGISNQLTRDIYVRADTN